MLQVFFLHKLSTGRIRENQSCCRVASGSSPQAASPILIRISSTAGTMALGHELLSVFGIEQAREHEGALGIQLAQRLLLGAEVQV